MAHEHHDHHGHHHHSVILTNVNRAFVIGIVFNLIFVIIEVVMGLKISSLSLLTDAGHNLADVASLALSLLAFRLLKIKSSSKYTYGYRKTSILVALLNATVLLISIGAIFYEAVLRFIHPEPLPGKIISIVAGIGIFINAFTGLMFFRDKENDMNIKSAYLHLMSDAVVSLGIVIGGVIIYFTNWYVIDSILGMIIAIVILVSTWSLLATSLRLSLDGVPNKISVDELKQTALSIKGVMGLHHIHVWAISTSENAMTAHLVLDDNLTCEQVHEIKLDLKHQFQHLNIEHVTLETERSNHICENLHCDK